MVDDPNASFVNPFKKDDSFDLTAKDATAKPAKPLTAAETKSVKKVDTYEVINKAKQAEFDRNKKRLERKSEILAEYGNLESMIPLGHEYWTLSS